MMQQFSRDDHTRPRRSRRSRAIGASALALTMVLAIGGPANATAAPSDPTARAAADGHQQGLTVAELRTDNVVNPLGIDNPTPALSWQLTGRVNGQRQSAYRILVAQQPGDLRSGRDLLWDSGKVTSDESVGIPYGGPALASSHRYYWSVQVWDQSGLASTPGPAARWEMGLLNDNDWAGAQNISPDVGEATSWSDFTLDADFTIVAGAASFLFRAKDSRNYYMWQINTANEPGKVLLRPHVQVNGSFANLGDIDISSVIPPETAGEQHHFTLRADGPTLTTFIDGTQVDTRTDTAQVKGTLGFRTSVSNGVTEKASYDNIVVRDLAGNTLFSDDFSATPDQYFPQSTITDGQLQPSGDPVLLVNDPSAPILRRDFHLDKKIAAARAYVYGLGFYELHLNGQKVGDHQLSPANSQYAQRSLYDTYDVTRLLATGENAVGIWLGNGYGERFNPYGFRWTGPKLAKLRLAITFADGSRQDVITDDGWTWSTGPIVANDIYAGETYDARQERTGWDTAGFDAAGWKPVRTVAAPSGQLVANTMPAERVVDTIRPIRLTQPKPGVYVYDLGQNFAGWTRLQVAGPAGSTVRLRTAEELGDDGMLDTVTNRSAASTDTYVLAGSGRTETYEPRFTYHGFRYLEVTGFPGTPTIDSIQGRVVHADVESTGDFSSSDPMLNRIWQNNRWGILNNSMSTPTDTAVRDERTPPAMDVQAYADASTREFGMNRFYAKYLGDLPPGVALPSDDVKSQYPDMAGGQVALAWTLFEQYGDRATLARNYPAMKKFVDTNAAAHPDHIWPENLGFGDWCPPDRSPAARGGLGGPGAGGNCTSEVSIVNTALWYQQALDTAKAAAALGIPADAEHFNQVADAVKLAFNDHFLNAAGNGYGSGRQTTSVLPLALGMVPDERLQAVGAQLVDTIMTADAGHLDTGIFGTRYLVDALARIGRLDVAMTILHQTSYPGFGFQISRGATTSWEQWLCAAGMQTHDHAMFAGINSSLYTVLAGIVPGDPGYRTVTIRPQLPPGLHQVRASQRTVRGTVSSSWLSAGRSFRLSVVIPVNASGTVHVPLSGAPADGVRATAGAEFLRVEDGAAVYAVGSGHWDFAVTG